MSFAISIGGNVRTSKVVSGTFRLVDNLNQQVDTCQFVTRKYGAETFVPELGTEVVVTRDGETIFGGVIVRITETVKAAARLEYLVECNDYSQYLKRAIVTERYEDMTVAEIVADLIDTYTTDGFTYANTTSTFNIASISFNRLTVAECLQKLADALSYVWYVDYDMDVHFFPKNQELAPFNLTDTSENYIYNSLEIVEDLTQVRNSIMVQGGEAESGSSRTEYWSGDATRVLFPLSNKFSEKPSVTVGGASKTVGIEYVDDDASFQCMWNYNEKYLRFTSGNVPGSGTNNIVVAGKYLYPIAVNVPAPASQVAYGAYAFAITDKTIRSQSEAIDRAKAELASYQRELYEGSFQTYNGGLRSGQVMTITSTQRDKAISVLIQSVTAIMRDPLGTSLKYHVKFATLKSMGIIDYLQNQLRSKELIVDDDESLLTLYGFEDTLEFIETLTAEVLAPPYNWGAAAWGYSQWG